MKTSKVNINRWIAVGTLGAMTLGGAVAMPTPAQAADSDTWKKVAIGAGIVTGYGLLKGQSKVTTVGALATAGSYYMYRHKKNQEQDQRQSRFRRFRR
jgi:hypothetical protein